MPMRNADGHVTVTTHQSPYMYQPLVDDILRNKREGTSCVLTQTNEEAVTLLALLRKHGASCKLIQSIEGFRFWNLAEMRYFLKYLDKRTSAPLIPDQLWLQAKQATFDAYAGSECLDYLKRCIEQFELISKAKYLTDLKDFVFESSVEDFCDISGDNIVISTIHKAKGKEFDNVYMLIDDRFKRDTDLMRSYYVGITRAKNNVSIHTNGNCFDRLGADTYIHDTRQYSMPDEIALQLTHKDVNLGFFKNRKAEILALRSGDQLTYSQFNLCSPATGHPVARLSAKMQTTITEWEKRGYAVKSATAHFIVAWKPKEAPKTEPETAVLLAGLTLTRNP